LNDLTKEIKLWLKIWIGFQQQCLVWFSLQ
jgi:hypothetical protein